MAALTNIKHEKFCIGIVKGLTPADAYVAAGYASANYKVAAAAASRLLNDGRICARIAELTEKATVKAMSKASLSKQWILERLMKNAKIALGEEQISVFMIDKESGQRVEVSITDRDASAANKALELLGKTVDIGMFVERQEIGNPGEFAAMTDEELVRRVDELNTMLVDGPDTIQ
jgi:phage terminase small subunit